MMTTETVHAHRHYYALVCPRGFSNEGQVVAFPNKETRDDYVNGYGGDCRPSERRYAISRSEARRALAVDYPISGNVYAHSDPDAEFLFGEARNYEQLPAGACQHIVWL